MMLPVMAALSSACASALRPGMPKRDMPPVAIITPPSTMPATMPVRITATV